MKFGRVPLDEADGVILAHAMTLADGRLGKGTRLGPAEISRLATNGVSAVIGATLSRADVAENEAAAAIGAALTGQNIRAAPAATGRVNLFAEVPGLLLVDRAGIDRMNEVDPGLTLATLAEYAAVVAGQMIATVKVIPLAVPVTAVEAAVNVLAEARTLAVSAFRPRRVALVQTELPGIKRTVLDKTRRSLEARLSVSASVVTEERRCAHETGALRDALVAIGAADLVIVFGASAVIDAEDVVPAAIREAGGRVHQLGMPVDPGNLLLLGEFRGKPILGAPGCARSPKENGFDWVLNRLIADVDITPRDIRRMGVGGLLTEIPSRPQPRVPVRR